MKIAVLGAGMVGSAIALDLASHYEVTAFDVSNTNLEFIKKRDPAIKIQEADLRDYSSYSKLLSSFDIVVTGVPGFMGYKTLEASMSYQRARFGVPKSNRQAVESKDGR